MKWIVIYIVIIDLLISGVVQCINPEIKDSEETKRYSEHQYSEVIHVFPHEPAKVGVAAIQEDIADNATTANPSYYATPRSHNNTGNPTKIMHYMTPNNVTLKVQPKASSGDYMAPPALNEYDTPSDIPLYDEAVNPSSFGNSMEYSVLSEILPDDEQIYEDPGHKKEKIYAWFEKKKFRKIDKNHIRILQKLGSGHFGTVNLGLWSSSSANPVQVAVKTLNSQCSESDRVKFLREAAIMGQFVHNNVVQLHGVVTEEENMMIILEYMSKGDLHDILVYLKTETPPEACNELEHDLLSFCRQIAAGMHYLASKKFVHRDLAARNILVSDDDTCKIADFVMARDVADDTYYITTGGKIPVKWTAPEAIFYKKYSTQSDVWSFGCVMYEIWSLGHKPFEDDDGKEYVKRITTGYRLPPPPGCPRAIYELMIECWHPTAKDHPTFGSITRTLQKSDRALLTSSVQAKDDSVTKGSQSMTLGAPLTEGSQLYIDLQQRYMTKSS